VVLEAQSIYNEDIESNRALGKFGGELIADGSTVLTHCNAARWPRPVITARRLGMIPAR